MSSYHPVDMEKGYLERAGVLSTVTCFTPAVMTMTVATLVISIALLRLHPRMTRNRLSRASANRSFATSCKVLVGVILRQISSCCAGVERKRSSFKFIILILVVFMFMVHFFFVAFIQTELVITQKPDIIDSYESILSRPQLRPYWLPYVRDFAHFMNAAGRSPEHRVWEKAQQMDEGCQQDYQQCFYRITTDNVAQTVFMLGQGNGVLIAGYAATSRIVAALCPMADLLHADPIISRYDRKAEGMLNSLLYNSYLNEQVRRVAFVRARRTLESGISGFVATCTTSPVESMVPKESIRICMANRTPILDPNFYEKKWSDFIILMEICISVTFAAAFLHAFQLIGNKASSHQNALRNNRKALTISTRNAHQMVHVTHARAARRRNESEFEELPSQRRHEH